MPSLPNGLIDISFFSSINSKFLNMFKFFITSLTTLLLLLTAYSCGKEEGGKGNAARTKGSANSHQEMVAILAKTNARMSSSENIFNSGAIVAYCDSILKNPQGLDISALMTLKFKRAKALLGYGDEVKSVAQYDEMMPYSKTLDANSQHLLIMDIAVAYMRLGERNNCINNHSPDACIMPIQGRGIHQDQTGSREAVKIFETILKVFPDDLDARWLLNISYMTLGEYPDKVPPAWLIPGLYAKSEYEVKPFEDIAAYAGLNVDDRAGGAVVEDFDNDGYLDIITSAWDLSDPMHFYKNNGDGTFTDRSVESDLSMLTGGLNIVDADYNNDGFVDFFVLRGAWQGQKGFGEQPNSLIKNNGDGTFTDVTTTAGVLSFRPTQTATWNDFNRDGWLDLFIGNETSEDDHPYACEFYINNQDGTFTNVAKETGLEVNRFAKGVTSGDFDNDGWPDLFISAINKMLLRNKGVPGKVPVFEDVTQKAGIDAVSSTFGTWFWDYDNDGWLDIFIANYEFGKPLSYYAASEALQPSNNIDGKMYLYHNNMNGTFTEVSHQVNLNKIAFAMGNNFGDIDNDGWLDFYLGTGNPSYQSLVPNKMFKNLGGKKFADVTAASRTGNLQKGHGVSFADLDNDGDQDIFTDMGGAFRGDHYPSSFFLNPGQNNNRWICINLEGTSSNRSAIGTRVEVKFRENGVQRSVFRDVNTGGSFGCSPLRREIGVGQATVIDEINIHWPVSGKVQTLRNVKTNQFIKVVEGKEGGTQIALKTLYYKSKGSKMPMCKTGDPISVLK